MEEKKYQNLIKKYKHLFTNEKDRAFTMFGIECEDGWYDLLEDLLEHIDKYINHKYKTVPEGFKIVQIKEKFGGLRFYVDGGDAVIHELIRFAENMSYRLCEFCGSNVNVKHSTGWIITACESCIMTKERLQGRDWSQ